MAARPWVQLTVAPFGAHLERWGRTEAGEWFGLAIWWQPVRYLDGQHPPGSVDCAGWFPARFLRPSEGQDYSEVDVTWLGPDPTGWPRPRDRREARWSRSGLFLGVIPDGRLKLPPGIVARDEPGRREG
jgi:hypothetical protein